MITLIYVDQAPFGRSRAGPDRFLSQPAPRLPRHDRIATQTVVGCASIVFHIVAVTVLLVLVSLPSAPVPSTSFRQTAPDPAPLRFVFLPKSGPGGGGGGGGNRQSGPIPRAQAKGHDAFTLPAAKPIASAPRPVDAPPQAQAVAIDAVPLASGPTVQVGLPDGLLTAGSSQGPGSGGGVGTGTGTGIGSGHGPGMGPGVGGGTGGGVYRPGGGVTTPTVIREVRPSYTPEAMRAKIQGLITLEVVVLRDGGPGDIRIVRSLDPGGLDRQAIAAVREWRFNPGRLNGVPVDVLVTIELSFRIH
ncbi:MAG TPA: energy transducer TonB [Vicinamibacterales bacterium]|nr:energy transducer TonB [Vicinamibacterales bacterium]